MSNNFKIAITDDHPAVVKALKKLLETNGYQVVIEAANGKDLIDQMTTSLVIPDTIILDINMPVMDGRETIRELKIRWPGTAIVVFSMDNDSIDDILLMGASAFLLKTSPTEMIIDTINRLNNVIE
jgi:DNA-binding NarL/FixJ family response regulator